MLNFRSLLPQRVTASPGWVSVKVLRTRLLQPERTASGRMYTEMGHLRCRMTSYGQGPCPFVGSGAVRAPAREREVPRCTSQGDCCLVAFSPLERDAHQSSADSGCDCPRKLRRADSMQKTDRHPTRPVELGLDLWYHRVAGTTKTQPSSHSSYGGAVQYLNGCQAERDAHPESA